MASFRTSLPVWPTIIMCSNKLIRLVFCMLAIIVSKTSISQNNPAEDSVLKRPQKLVLFIGGGASWYLSSLQPPVDNFSNFQKTWPCTTIRLMWFPQYRLRFGIESGTTTFYSYDVKDSGVTGNVKLNAIPLMFTWSMHIIKGLNIYAGFGSYFLTTHLDYKGSVKSEKLSLGSNIALAYQYPLSKKFDIALEGKWENAFVSKNNALSLQIQIAWKFLEWQRRK